MAGGESKTGLKSLNLIQFLKNNLTMINDVEDTEPPSGSRRASLLGEVMELASSQPANGGLASKGQVSGTALEQTRCRGIVGRINADSNSGDRKPLLDELACRVRELRSFTRT